MTARCIAALAIVLAACGGDPTPRPTESHAVSRPRAEGTSEPEPEAQPELARDDEVALEPAAPAEPDFDAPLPTEPCPEVRVRLAHRSAPELPALLTHAIAFRAEDGRHLRVVLSDEETTRDALGRFVDPPPGHARFELDALRWRRGPIEPRVLGTTESRRGALTHVRIVQAGPALTFGNREIGDVELTEVTAERVCGRIDLNDGFGRVRGGFTAPVVGPLPR